ncbi:MAG: hypothetical protein WCI04_03310 [archaeon]
MEKTYTKTGYNYTNLMGKITTVSREMVEKSIIDQNKLLLNIQKNIENLNADLVAIDNSL